jgi:hypothetical protein
MRTVALAVAFVLAGSTAQAALLIAGNVGGSTFTCADNDPLCDTNPTTSILQLADQVINGVTVNGSIQTSTKGPVNVLDTSSLSIINNNATATAITFTVSDTNFIGPATSFVSIGSGTFSGPVRWQPAHSFCRAVRPRPRNKCRLKSRDRWPCWARRCLGLPLSTGGGGLIDGR